VAPFAPVSQFRVIPHLMLRPLTHEAEEFSMFRRPVSKEAWEKAKPPDSRTAGRTRALVKSSASASSDPSNNFGPIWAQVTGPVGTVSCSKPG
jgi:hypothetical protein